MKKISKKSLSLFALLCLICSACASLSGCAKNNGGEGEYTYKTYSSALGTNWNPHTWEVNADSAILGYIYLGI